MQLWYEFALHSRHILDVQKWPANNNLKAHIQKYLIRRHKTIVLGNES
jgi:hypothetical protein